MSSNSLPNPQASPLSIHALPTPIFRSGESLADFIIANVPPNLVTETMIVAVTTKIVSLAERRLVAKSSIEKSALIEREADHNLGPIGYGSILTVKAGLFIASAGIDESNSEHGDYILYPKNPFASAQNLHTDLCRRWKIEKLGVLLTDSRTTPLRLGVTGVSLAHWGFRGLQNKVGQTDLFGRPLAMTKVNIADGLAAAATLVMGEADESRPLALISGAAVEFSPHTDVRELTVALEDDLYFPFFQPFLRPRS